MEVFEVRAWTGDKEIIVKMNLDAIALNPQALNMIDVGIIFVNEYRKVLGLKPIDPASVTCSIEDLRRTGKL